MYILFDIGGTKTRIASSQDGKTISEPEIFDTPKDYTQGLDRIKDAISKLVGTNQIESAVCGIAGPLDEERTKLTNSPQLPDWVGKLLKEDLQKLLNSKVFIENDAALAGLGEAIHGAGQGYSIVAYLTISTGVGGVKIVDGKIDKNSLGFEPGNMFIEDGRLQDLISGMALEKKYRMKPQDINDARVWDEMANNLAQGLNNIIVDWSPQILILGGGVSNSIPIENVKTYLSKLMKIFPEIPPIEKAALGDLSGLYGALEYLKQTSTL